MNTLSPSLRIAVIRGGSSDAYSSSLSHGAAVLEALRETHTPIDIFVDTAGIWHVGGIPKSPEKILPLVDVAFNTVGSHNDTETFSKEHITDILRRFGVPYAGSDALARAHASNTSLARNRFTLCGIHTPLSSLIRRTDDSVAATKRVFETQPAPFLVRPAHGGVFSSHAIFQNRIDMLDALPALREKFGDVVIEEYIPGKKASCGVLEHFRNIPLYALPPVEHMLVDGTREFRAPGRFSPMEKREMEMASLLAHRSLGARGMSESHFVISPTRGVYLLGVHTTPNCAHESSFTAALHSIGSSVTEYIHHLLSLALGRE